jgi:hypothetical protein
MMDGAQQALLRQSALVLQSTRTLQGMSTDAVGWSSRAQFPHYTEAEIEERMEQFGASTVMPRADALSFEVLQCVQIGRIKRSATIEAPASALTTGRWP